jgi:CheY-like chemotaxis protein
MSIQFHGVDLGGVIAAAVESLRPTAEAKRVELKTSIGVSHPPMLGDAQRLQQVVWNLLSNALRFTPSGGLVQVELSYAGSQAELRVSDNGIGIAPDFLPHVFERFAQADSSITRTHGGLGMGLAIVKYIVELHGGVISAASEGVGRGAVFTVKLPVGVESRAPEPAARTPLQSLQRPTESRHALVGMKILVVDDEPDTCDLLRFIFNEAGAIVQVATGAVAAIQLFDKWEPDILVADIGMPAVDGYQLIRAIRSERGSGIPAVALTALARIDDRIKALSAGYQMHVAKPVEPSELISIVTSLVGLVNRELR